MGLKAGLANLAPVDEDETAAAIVQPSHSVLSSLVRSAAGLEVRVGVGVRVRVCVVSFWFLFQPDA